MKLSEMSTEKAMVCMAQITPSVRSILEHPQVARMIAEKQRPDKKQLTDILLALVKEKKTELLTVLSAMTEKTTDAIMAQPLELTLKDISTTIDADLLSFFI